MLLIPFLALPEVNHGEDQAKGIAGAKQAEEGPYTNWADQDNHLRRPWRPCCLFRLLCLPILAEQRTVRSRNCCRELVQSL